MFLSGARLGADQLQKFAFHYTIVFRRGKSRIEIHPKLPRPLAKFDFFRYTGCIETVYNRTNKPVLEGPVANMYLHPECPWILITCCWSGKICFWDLKAQRLLRVYVVNVVSEID